MKELKYQTIGDYEFPVLKGIDALPQLSRFGLMYLKHLKENEKGHYFALITENKLNEELVIMDQQMNEQYDLLVKQFIKARNITEDLKQKDQMKWVQEMNSIKQCADEVVCGTIFND